MSKTEFLLRQWETTLGWYRQAEDKARFLVAVNTAVVAVCNGLVLAAAADGARQLSIGAGSGLLLALLGMALLFSFGFVLQTLWARHSDRPADGSPALWFFGDVARLSPAAHAAAVAALPTEAVDSALEPMLAAQCHALAVNVMRKHQALNLGIACTVSAVTLLFVLAALQLA